MDKSFYQSIFEKQQQTEDVPANAVITGWAMELIRLLYPEQAKQFFASPVQFEAERTRADLRLGNEHRVSYGGHL